MSSPLLLRQDRFSPYDFTRFTRESDEDATAGIRCGAAHLRKLRSGGSGDGPMDRKDFDGPDAPSPDTAVTEASAE